MQQGVVVGQVVPHNPAASVRGSAFQASTASGVDQTVKPPQTRRPASYSAQLVTRCRCLGMR